MFVCTLGEPIQMQFICSYIQYANGYTYYVEKKSETTKQIKMKHLKQSVTEIINSIKSDISFYFQFHFDFELYTNHKSDAHKRSTSK